VKTAATGGNQDNQQRNRRTETAGRHQPAKRIARHKEQHQHHAKGGARADPSTSGLAIGLPVRR
jgi:ribosomal protein S8E